MNTNDITPEEKEIVDLLGEAWNKFLKLPVQHPNEKIEFCQNVHILQDKLLARSAIRQLKLIKDEHGRIVKDQ